LISRKVTRQPQREAEQPSEASAAKAVATEVAWNNLEHIVTKRTRDLQRLRCIVNGKWWFER
jgi:hypothetical protein